MRTIVVGLGNPILSDDGVGIEVARLVRPLLAGRPGVEVTESYAGGLRLMEAIAGYDRAVVVDAMTGGGSPPGTVHVMAAGDATRNLSCAHDADLESSLALGRELGLHLPAEVEVVGIEAGDVENFSEQLTPAVRASLPAAVARVLAVSLQESEDETEST